MARTARLRTLTALQVKAYIDNPRQTKPLHDGGGLYLRKRDASSRWYLRMTEPATGAEQWHQLFPDDPAGGYPNKSLAQARTEADRLRAIRSAGLDPRAERERAIQAQAERDAAAAREAATRKTVRQVFELWRATDLQPHVVGDGERRGRKDGGKQAASQFERYVFPDHGDTPLLHLTRADILACVDKVKSNSNQRLAEMLYANLRQMLNFALARELMPVDLMAGLKRSRIVGKPVRRDRVLGDNELVELAKALPEAKMDPRSVAAIWLYLATGARRGELMGGVWADSLPVEPNKRRAKLSALQEMLDAMAAEDRAEDMKLGIVDTEARTWHLPTTKNQRSHTIHLSDFALSRLAEVRELRELVPGCDATLSPWLFPGADPGQPGRPSRIGKQIADRQKSNDDAESQRWKGRSKAREALKLEGGRWTVHDLRRTAATIMARQGFSNDVIDEVLNHKAANELAAIYIRDRREAEQQRALDALGKRLSALIKLAATENVDEASMSQEAAQLDEVPA